MKNFDIFTKTTKRKFLKIFGVSLLGSLGYGLFTHKKSQIDKTIGIHPTIAEELVTMK